MISTDDFWRPELNRNDCYLSVGRRESIVRWYCRYFGIGRLRNADPRCACRTPRKGSGVIDRSCSALQLLPAVCTEVFGAMPMPTPPEDRYQSVMDFVLQATHGSGVPEEIVSSTRLDLAQK